ncbi:zinc finger protein 598 [Camelus ferus]|nr:zinc finger protein 598 [Camelus ferus]
MPLYFRFQVVFGRKLPAFATIPIHQLQHEKKYDIYFADGKVFALYRQLLQHECPRCPELPPFGLFGDLEQHMRKQHELFCCKLCLKHLKSPGVVSNQAAQPRQGSLLVTTWGLQAAGVVGPVTELMPPGSFGGVGLWGEIFTYERKWYSRKDLARHRMQGDPDDTSHRGHPLCKFCDERYLDNDELLKHLRRDHYFCHFCDSDGAQDYYSDYAYLREHFREKHFLCEEGRCSTEQFTHAFRTEIDLKAHRTACHSRSRAEARQNRQIDLQFSYAPRHSRRNEGGGKASAVQAGALAVVLPGPMTGCVLVAGVVSGEDYEELDRSEDQVEGTRPRKEEAVVRGPEEPRGPRRPPLRPGLRAKAQLKDEDFPSLCASASSSSSTAAALGPVGLPLAYAVPSRGRSTFQEDDFPALVSSASKPTAAPTSLISAWNSSGSKKSAGGSSQPSRKAGKGGKGGKKGGPPPVEEEEDGRTGLTAQELRSVPTTVTVSSLLALASTQTFTKVGKKKKVGSEKPGFNTVVLLKGTPPPPPPGLVPPISKPPPGFSGLLPSPHPACVPSTTTTTKAPRLTSMPRAYLVPENFRERNLQLIQSIKDFLQSDEARFNKFKSHSGEFRQGVISAAQYYKSCRDLLGENFQKIFNELLVLLPDTAKQQELLSAHTDFRGQERPPGTKAKKNKKNAWQASTRQTGLDCCVCPTCQQVLAHGDVRSHQALHAARDDDFPSLQAIARILT